MWQGESDNSSEDSEEELIRAARESEDPSASAPVVSDSEYEVSPPQEEASSDEDEEEPEENSPDSCSPTPSSDDDMPKKKKSSSKLDDKTRKLLEENNYLRRSNRSKSSSSRKIESSPEEASSESESDLEPSQKRKTVLKKVNGKDNRFVKRATVNKKVNYAEKSDEDFDEEDVLEWEEDEVETEQSTSAETIEKILKSRIGIFGATGSNTTCYNVAEKGDPNVMKEGAPKEEQFLIKWVGWSHLHNTWESETTITQMGVKGIKKLQNYIKKEVEERFWRKTADKEYLEFYDCEREMNEELYEQYKIAERIVAHQVSRDKTVDGQQATEYLVKWSGLSYADCTWEDERLLPRDKLEEYHRRVENSRPPNKNALALKKRPKFDKLERTPSYLIPPGREEFNLRDYQLEGLNWMLNAWCKTNSCILADEMGLGKTIQSISFLSTLYHRYDVTGPFLVVVPLSTMAAWQKEFSQWGPELNMITYMGDGIAREQIRQFDWYVAGSKKMKVNAVLTTYEILLKDKPFLGSFQWAVLAVDEAHRLKNDESLLYKSLAAFDCDHRLLITGTPLQNSLKELWALLHFIMPEKFDSWAEFEKDHNDTDHRGISSLHKKLEPYLLRRVKKDVEKSLPPKLEQILRVDMTAQQKQYYKWILTKNYRELSKGVKGSINGFVNLCMELKKCCNHTSLVRAYDHYDPDPQARLQQILKSSGKLILLDKLLCRLKDTGHRVLIFSQMVMMLDILQEYLKLRRFSSQRLDGSMRADLRKQALDHFNAEGSTDFCFLLSTRAGGLGINLATADTVVIFDSDWNPQNDLQAMSRAHRIGQTKTVNIYRLVTKASVEEEIVERAKRKLVLDHLVIQRMDTSGRMVLSKSNDRIPFDKHELNDILKFGAAELFQEKEGEEKEPEVDIDRILMGAETRDAEEGQEGGNELLNSFKYANFAIDEEKDIAAAAGSEWDEIIPEEQRAKIEEEERKKFAAELDLLPRNRKLLEGPAGSQSGSSSDESDSDKSDDGGRKKKKKAWGDFSPAEVKRFVRSFRKFSKPLERLEAIAQDAELEEHSKAEMTKIVEAMLEGCAKAEEEFSKQEKKGAKDKDKEDKTSKGPFFKFSGVDVNVKQIRRLHNELEPLHAVLKDNWQAPMPYVKKAKPQKGWDVEWAPIDDEAILRGIFKYGMGSWEGVKMDPQLGLADKIFLKDKVRKPQRQHVQQRLEYLLKLLRKQAPKKGKTMSKDLKEKKRKHEEEKVKVVPEKKKKEKAESNHKKTTFDDQLSLLHIDKSMYGSALDNTKDRPFNECVKILKPVQKYLKKLSKGKADKDYNRYLMKLGNHCRDQLEKLIEKKPNLNLRKWYNYVWIFASRFIPNSDAAEMAERYRELLKEHHKHKKDGKKEKGKEEKHHKNHEKKEDKKEKKKEKDKKEGKKDSQHKDHHKSPSKEPFLPRVLPSWTPSKTLPPPPLPPVPSFHAVPAIRPS